MARHIDRKPGTGSERRQGTLTGRRRRAAEEAWRIDREWRGDPELYNQVSGGNRHHKEATKHRGLETGNRSQEPRTGVVAEGRESKRETETEGRMLDVLYKGAATPEGCGRRRGTGCGKEMWMYRDSTGVTVAGTSLYGSRPHPRRAELWSAEHGEVRGLLRKVRSREPWRGGGGSGRELEAITVNGIRWLSEETDVRRESCGQESGRKACPGPDSPDRQYRNQKRKRKGARAGTGREDYDRSISDHLLEVVPRGSGRSATSGYARGADWGPEVET
ncbi:hypothetical protein C8R47DRAFT_1191033 [Mycena vitilis]|nr:hypothetical protein C8R47DRAFT_1191033 [Mycena vitilis]